MSWGRRELKKAYNRLSEKRRVNKDLDDEHYSMYWGDFFENDYEDHYHPTMKEIAVGRLLTMLVKLRIRYARGALDRHYW